jgi:hypothetical protein
MHSGNKTDLAQKMSPRGVKQATYGETRTANIKKKLMKNKLSGEAAAPANADQLSSNRAERVTKYNYNRELPTQKVLEFLRAQLPQQYELAEIVGKWIWLEFPKASNRAAANTLRADVLHVAVAGWSILVLVTSANWNCPRPVKFVPLSVIRP